jgi:cob(I)alamin adenosyltransferase
MADDLRRQLREIEQALFALGEVIAVRREYVTLLVRLGAREREVAALDALIKAHSQLQLQRDDLAASLASRAR